MADEGEEDNGGFGSQSLTGLERLRVRKGGQTGPVLEGEGEQARRQKRPLSGLEQNRAFGRRKHLGQNGPSVMKGGAGRPGKTVSR